MKYLTTLVVCCTLKVTSIHCDHVTFYCFKRNSHLLNVLSFFSICMIYVNLYFIYNVFPCLTVFLLLFFCCCFFVLFCFFVVVFFLTLALTIIVTKSRSHHISIISVTAQSTHAPGASVTKPPGSQCTQLFHSSLFGPSVLEPHLN